MPNQDTGQKGNKQANRAKERAREKGEPAVKYIDGVELAEERVQKSNLLNF
jgi:hypothetical protein